MKELNDTAIIFNHVPKVGGTSLIHFYREIFGEERCFRHRARNSKDDSYSKSIGALTSLELSNFDFIAGQFDYGNHERIKDRKYKYIGVVRDPLDRVISDYYFNQQYGRADRKKMTKELSLEDYIKFKLSKPNSKLITSCQIQYLTGQFDLSKAKEIIDNEYLIACTTSQLTHCQTVLSKIYNRPDLEPKFINSSKQKKTHILSDEITETIEEAFKLDREFIVYIENKFDSLYL